MIGDLNRDEFKTCIHVLYQFRVPRSKQIIESLAQGHTRFQVAEGEGHPGGLAPGSMGGPTGYPWVEELSGGSPPGAGAEPGGAS